MQKYPRAASLGVAAVLAGPLAAAQAPAALARVEPLRVSTSVMVGPNAAGSVAAAAQKSLIAVLGPNDDPRLSARTSELVKNLDYLQTLPFDGVVVDIPAGWSAMENGTTLNYDQEYRDWVQPLDGKLGKLDQNFLRLQVHRPANLFDDAVWGQVAANWGVMARLAGAGGFQGIWFDDEYYDGAWDKGLLNYEPNAEHDLATTQEKARQRGEEIMTAVVAANPSAKVMVAHSPAEAAPGTPTPQVTYYGPHFDALELSIPFFAGLLTAAREPGQVIDGGEYYWHRSADDFKVSCEWSRSGIVDDPGSAPMIAVAQRDRWKNMVGCAFGQFNKPYPADDPKKAMTPDVYRKSLANALVGADRFVWAYAEGDDWLVPGGMPVAWKQAVEGAVADSQNP
jgi:hypothetical protein